MRERYLNFLFFVCQLSPHLHIGPSESASQSPPPKSKSRKPSPSIEEVDDADGGSANADPPSVLLMGHGEDDELLCVFLSESVDQQKLIATYTS